MLLVHQTTHLGNYACLFVSVLWFVCFFVLTSWNSSIYLQTGLPILVELELLSSVRAPNMTPKSLNFPLNNDMVRATVLSDVMTEYITGSNLKSNTGRQRA